MTLRKKTLIIIGLTVAGLIAILYLASHLILMRGFCELEDKVATRNVKRALEALSDQISRINTLAVDWAYWDDTYEFMVDGNKEYIDSNLVDETFLETRLNFIIYLDTKGNVFFAKGIDLENEREIPITDGLKKHFYPDAPLLRHTDASSVTKGVLLLDEGALLIVSRPILTSLRKGPVRGALIMARYLKSEIIQRLAKATHLSVTIVRVDDPEMPPDFRMAQAALSKEKPVIIKPLSKDSIAGYALINDLDDKPVLVLRVEMPRGIYGQGKLTSFYVVLMLIVAGFVFAVVVSVLLGRLVLDRISALDKQVGSIAGSKEFFRRVSIKGKDELSDLADVVNQLLIVMEQTEKELVRAKEEWERTFNTVPDLIAIIDTEYRIVRANKPMADKLGITPQEAVGLTCYENVHGLKEPPDFCPHAKLLADSKEHVSEVYEERLGGTFLVSVSPLRDERGRLIGSVHVARDITERKKMEEELREKLSELERFHRVTMGREKRVIELKKEVERLRKGPEER